MCRMIVLAAAKKGPKTTPIVLSLQTIESRKSALILMIYPTFYCDFLQVPHKPKDKFFCHADLSAKLRISYEILKNHLGTVAR